MVPSVQQSLDQDLFLLCFNAMIKRERHGLMRRTMQVNVSGYERLSKSRNAVDKQAAGGHQGSSNVRKVDDLIRQ